MRSRQDSSGDTLALGAWGGGAGARPKKRRGFWAGSPALGAWKWALVVRGAPFQSCWTATDFLAVMRIWSSAGSGAVLKTHRPVVNLDPFPKMHEVL